MKIKVMIFVLGALFVFTHSAESGAAVAMQNKKKAGGRPGQLPPGYRIGPNGVQRIPEAGENESPSREAAERGPEDELAEVKDVVDLNQILEAMQASSKSWELIISRQDKQIIVQEFIKKYSGQGVVIHKPAAFYVNFIDEMSKGSPEMLEAPFERILQIVAVMEYDFDNGQNKDLLAQKILGPQFYESNKKRLMNESANAQPHK